MVRPSQTLSELLDSFICVRVTDMRGVDLARYPFDFDLTFALLAMDGDGHVYHRYGGRDERGADTWLSSASLEHMLERSLAEHDKRVDPTPAALPDPLRIEELPSFKKRDKGECIHCHSVNTSFYEEARDAGELDLDWIWKHPAPARIGLDLDRDDQQLVTAVEPKSASAAAGLRAGDRLVSVQGTPIASAADVMFALDRAPAIGGELNVLFERGGTRHTATLTLTGGWKRGTPRDFAWRPTKWAMTPAPGFGGPQLDAAALRELKLPADTFAFRVQYMVTWGDNRRYGQAAARAGLRNGDVVLSVGGVNNFESVEHFHAWWRLRVEFGQSVPIEVLRAGERHTLQLTAVR